MYETVKIHKGLSIERLLLLCEVACAGGIKAAVGEDATRQSLASRQLKELGAFAGAELFHKVGRSLVMTESGKALAQIGNRFFSELESLLRSTHEMPQRFNLGIGDSLFQWHLLPRMKAFEKQFPNTQLIPFSYSAREIARMVDAQILDAGLIRHSALTTGTSLVAKPVGEVKFRLFIPAVLTPSATQQTLPKIHTLPFCTLTGDGEYAHAMKTFLTAFNGHPALNCSSMTQIYAAVQSGQYAAILPENAATGLSVQATKTYTLPELAPFTRQIALIYRNDAAESKEKAPILKFLSQSITTKA